jgi:hypothetical protein
MYSILSAITHKLNVSGYMFIWTFFLVLVCGTRAKGLSSPFSYTLHNVIQTLDKVQRTISHNDSRFAQFTVPNMCETTK